MSEYQCRGHAEFVTGILSQDPDAWIACEHPERMPDDQMCCNELCEKCMIVLEAASRIGKKPTQRIYLQLGE